jgi:hypothetical protein
VIVKLLESWGQIDWSHRKLASRGFGIDLVHISKFWAAHRPA